MKKSFIVFVLMLCSLQYLGAQEMADKNAMVLRMGNVEFKDPVLVSKIKPEFKEVLLQILEETVRTAAGESKRFAITDSLTAAKLDEEMRSEMAAIVDDPQRASELRKKAFETIFAVDWVMNAEINKVQMQKKGNYGYICLAQISVSLKDRHSDVLRIIDSRNFANLAKETKIRPTAEHAFREAMTAIYPSLVSYFTNNFGVYGKITHLDKNNNAVLNCGLKYNIQKGDRFQVTHMVPQKTADGKFYYQERVIGTLKVKQPLDDVSICDITSGEEEIININEKGGFMQCKKFLDRKY